MKLKILKIIELVLNYATLVWLIFISFTTYPTRICFEYIEAEINRQYGIVYLINITIALESSVLIILRLIKPTKALRIISGIIIILTMALTFLTFFEGTDFSIEEIVRKIIFE